MRPMALSGWLLPLLLIGCTLSPPSPRPDQLSFPPLVFDLPHVEKLELPNGIRLYLKEDRELPLVEVTALVGVGAIGDPLEKTGLTGLFAETLRTGGAGDLSPEALDETLEMLAAELSVAGDTYATSLELSLRSEDLETGLGVLSDLLLRPRFSPERLDLARRRAKEAVRRQNDDPGEIAGRTLRRAVYGDHPLGRTPTEETLNAVGRDDLLERHRRHFHPENLRLAVSGDFDRALLLSVLEKLFGDWEQGKGVSQEIPALTAEFRPSVLVASKEIPQTTILMGHLGIDKESPDLYATRVMNFILGGGGFNSRLMREVRSDRGLAYSVYSYYQVGRRLPGLFVAGCETKSSSTLEAAGLMRQIMTGMRERVVDPDELALAKESLINSFVFSFTDSHAVVTQTMTLDFYGYPDGYLESYRDRLAAVEAEDVLAAARRHLRPEELAVVLVGDDKAFDAPPGKLGLPVESIPLGR